MHCSLRLLLLLSVFLFPPVFALGAEEFQIIEEAKSSGLQDVVVWAYFQSGTKSIDLSMPVRFKQKDEKITQKKFSSMEKFEESIVHLPRKNSVLVRIHKTRMSETEIRKSLKNISRFFDDAGFKSLVFSMASNGGAVAVDSKDAVVSGGVAQEQLDWVKVTDKAAWQARDSQGELVYKDKLWIFGGWFNSYKPCPRDVWNSADGKDWNLIQKAAPWKHSDLSMVVVFKDKMWLMGGWYNGRLPDHSSSNQVWNSVDGVKWEQVTGNAAWTPRVAAGLVSFKGKMWILGGIEDYYFGDQKSIKNDVWSSSNGKQWTLETKSAGWSPRAYHQALVFDDKIWVFGGGNYVPEYQANNDVWNSEDGVHWKKVTAAAAWGPRLWFSSVVYRDRMFVLGGWQKEQDNYGDVWYSKDGKNWKELKSKVIWKGRHEHSAFVFKDRIWLAGGHARPLSNEVWSLQIPKDWFGDRRN